MKARLLDNVEGLSTIIHDQHYMTARFWGWNLEVEWSRGDGGVEASLVIGGSLRKRNDDLGYSSG